MFLFISGTAGAENNNNDDDDNGISFNCMQRREDGSRRHDDDNDASRRAKQSKATQSKVEYSNRSSVWPMISSLIVVILYI